MNSFPLPIVENYNTLALPEFAKINFPRDSKPLQQEEATQKIIEQWLKELALVGGHRLEDWNDKIKKEYEKRYLPCGELWSEDNKEFSYYLLQEQVYHAFTIPIKLKKGPSFDEQKRDWCQAFWKVDKPPQYWQARKKDKYLYFELKEPDKNIFTTKFGPSKKVTQILKIEQENIVLTNEKQLAIVIDFKNLQKHDDTIKALLVKEFKKYIDQILPAIPTQQTESSVPFQHKAILFLLYAWWTKRGGSIRKFCGNFLPILAKQTNCYELSTYAKSLKKSDIRQKWFSPSLLWALKLRDVFKSGQLHGFRTGTHIKKFLKH